MRNFLTVQIESYMGAVFVALLGAFFIGIIFIAIKNLNSDLTVINAEQAQVRTNKQ